MDATLILCDFAEAINGKLYVMGGGWNVLQIPGQPVNMALGIIVSVPWDQTNIRHELRAELQNHDGAAVEINGQPVVVGGGFELGRPAGVKPGTDLNIPLAFSLNNLALPEGGYVWVLLLDGDKVGRCPFTVQLPTGTVAPPR